MTTAPSGILLIDKPRGMTSHDVVDRVRRVAGTRRVGHTGTLDPLADGLLVVCIGGATVVSQFLTGLEKIYLGTARLGAISSTYDAEGEITEQDRPLPADSLKVEQAMRLQLGSVLQLPPPYSAIKIKGRKLYEYARAGEVVPQQPRRVTVSRFELLHFESPRIHFLARVGSGTYIRSMIHDLGLELGCGAYLEALRRTQIGGFGIDQAVPLDKLIQDPGLLPAHLLNITEALGHLPKLTIQPEAESAILNGCAFRTSEILEFEGIIYPGQPVLVINTRGRALSVVKAESAEDEIDPPIGSATMIFRPLRVLAQP
ncbi:tRNA pseudouridine(55) synthase TruB [bacterium]|nr:tRNA pseudouridine(55) synthase TruB [bacterium]